MMRRPGVRTFEGVTAMTNKLIFASLAAAMIGIAPTMPAHAQGSALIIYGADKCPSNTVCVRAPESERYRIPQSLRGEALPLSQSPNRNAAVSSVGGMNTGPATCSNIGGGGGSSCLKNQIQAWSAEKQTKKTEDAQSPEPK
jgi:hypothetical protein